MQCRQGQGEQREVRRGSGRWAGTAGGAPQVAAGGVGDGSWKQELEQHREKGQCRQGCSGRCSGVQLGACVIRSGDNGSEFKEGEFQRRLKTPEKPIAFELAPSCENTTSDAAASFQPH
eukprot:COSAG01_NODE_14739_length_1416_cov_2.679575_2_plen_119_part_00